MDTLLIVFSIVGGLYSLGSLVAVIFHFWNKRVTISLRRIPGLVSKLVNDLASSNYIPDIIIGIGRSGLIFSGIISANIGTVTVGIWERKEKYSEDGKLENVEIIDNFETDIKGKRVLLVSGECKTGLTFIRALEHSRKNEAKVAKTLSFYRLKHSRHEPDFCPLIFKNIPRVGWRDMPIYKK